MSRETTVKGNTERFSDEFSALIRPHLDVMRRVALKLTRDPSDAEDLLQDVLLTLYKNREKLEQIKILKPWLLRVIRNLFVEQRGGAALVLLIAAISLMASAADAEDSD